MLFAGSLIATVVGIWGMTFICVKNRIVSFVFGFVLMAVMVFIFSVGVVLMGVSGSSPEQLAKFCEN